VIEIIMDFSYKSVIVMEKEIKAVCGWNIRRAKKFGLERK